MTIERRARQAIREMAQAPDKGYTREEVLVTFLQAERDDMREQVIVALRLCLKEDWKALNQSEMEDLTQVIRALE